MISIDKKLHQEKINSQKALKNAFLFVANAAISLSLLASCASAHLVPLASPIAPSNATTPIVNSCFNVQQGYDLLVKPQVDATCVSVQKTKLVSTCGMPESQLPTLILGISEFQKAEEKAGITNPATQGFYDGRALVLNGYDHVYVQGSEEATDIPRPAAKLLPYGGHEFSHLVIEKSCGYEDRGLNLTTTPITTQNGSSINGIYYKDRLLNLQGAVCLKTANSGISCVKSTAVKEIAATAIERKVASDVGLADYFTQVEPNQGYPLLEIVKIFGAQGITFTPTEFENIWTTSMLQNGDFWQNLSSNVEREYGIQPDVGSIVYLLSQNQFLGAQNVQEADLMQIETQAGPIYSPLNSNATTWSQTAQWLKIDDPEALKVKTNGFESVYIDCGESRPVTVASEAQFLNETKTLSDLGLIQTTNVSESEFCDARLDP
jgi:hypothetical protein